MQQQNSIPVIKQEIKQEDNIKIENEHAMLDENNNGVFNDEMRIGGETLFTLPADLQ